MNKKQYTGITDSQEKLFEILDKNLVQLSFFQFIIRADGKIEPVYFSKNIGAYLGYSGEEISQHPNLFFNGLTPSIRDEFFNTTGIGYRGDRGFDMEFKYRLTDGSEKWLKLSANPSYEADGSIIWNNTLNDISDRKKDEATLLKFNRELRFRNIVTDKLIKLSELQDVYDTVCDSMVKDGNYVLACIYLMPEGNQFQERLRACSMSGRVDYLKEIMINLSDEQLSHGPTGTALIQRKTIVTNNFNITEITKPWWEKAKKYNIAASIAIPLHLPANKAGAMVIYSENINAFDSHEVGILERIAENISLFAHNIHHKKEAQKSSYFLNERIKELKLLYTINQILQKVGLNKEETCLEIIQSMPQGWQFNDYCESRIICNHLKLETPGFSKGIAFQKGTIATSKGVLGTLEVAYTKEFEPSDEGPFLKEERELLNTICEMIGDYFEKKDTDFELYQSKANLSTIFSNTDIGYVLLDNKLNIIAFNDSFQNTYGKQVGTLFELHKNFLEILPAERRMIKTTAIEKAIQTKKSVSYEICHRKDGLERYFNIDINPVLMEDDLIGICLSAYDISKHKQIEIDQQKISQDLLQRNRDLEQFSYIVSHNIRAPLAQILGLKAILKNKIDPKDHEIAIQGIISAAEALDTVMRDVTKTLQIKNEVANEKELVSFQQLVEDIQENLFNIMVEKHAVIRTDFFAIESLYTVKSFLQSIFYNLIINAIKFSRKSVAPELTIRSSIKNKEVHIEFEDNGIGIDLDRYENELFGLYKRFHLEVEGRGLGLFMIKSEVEYLGGKITVRSMPDRGSIFTVILPL